MKQFDLFGGEQSVKLDDKYTSKIKAPIYEPKNKKPHQSKGNVFLTIANASITQKQTQKTKGGMTDIYINNGTYIKSFYSIICAPSCVKIRQLNSTQKRLHHSIDWNSTVPCIINEKYKL